jgi:hypothetical protein
MNVFQSRGLSIYVGNRHYAAGSEFVTRGKKNYEAFGSE